MKNGLYRAVAVLVFAVFAALGLTCVASVPVRQNVEPAPSQPQPEELPQQVWLRQVERNWVGDGGIGTSIAILPPKAIGLEENRSYLPALVQGEFVSNFSSYSAISVLDRVRLDDQYLELLSDIYDNNAEARQDLGHLSPTTHIMGGSITKTAAGYILQVYITKTIDKMTTASYSRTFTFAELDNLTGIRLASLELLQKMGVALTENSQRALAGPADDNHVSAQTALARGVTAQKQGTEVAALSHYFQAAAFDPSLQEAVDRSSALNANISSGSAGGEVESKAGIPDTSAKILTALTPRADGKPAADAHSDMSDKILAALTPGADGKPAADAPGDTSAKILTALMPRADGKPAADTPGDTTSSKILTALMPGADGKPVADAPGDTSAKILTALMPRADGKPVADAPGDTTSSKILTALMPRADGKPVTDIPSDTSAKISAALPPRADGKPVAAAPGDTAWRRQWIERLTKTEQFLDNFNKMKSMPYTLFYLNDISRGVMNYQNGTVTLSIETYLYGSSIWTLSVERALRAMYDGLQATGRAGDWGLADWPRKGVTDLNVFVTRSSNFSVVFELVNDSGKVIGRQTLQAGGSWGFSSSDRPSISISAADRKFLGIPNVNINDITGNLTIRIAGVNGADAETATKNGTLQIRAITKDEVDMNDRFQFVKGEIHGFANDAAEVAELVIPNNIWGEPVISITAGAFRGIGLTAVTLPNSITSIGDGTFRDNRLTDITIPSSVTAIGDSVFYQPQFFPPNGKITITMGANVAMTGKSLLANPNFEGFYNQNDKQAGIYTLHTSFFTDPRDDKRYRAVWIGDNAWMAQNLNYKTDKSWCYDNNASGCGKYGSLYSWSEAMEACPRGWHLPGRGEWNSLVQAAGDRQAGKSLKSKADWYKSGNGTDEFDFSAMPGGLRNIFGYFNYAGEYGYWWSATEGGGGTAYSRHINYNFTIVYENYEDKRQGFSVRCVQDLENAGEPAARTTAQQTAADFASIKITNGRTGENIQRTVAHNEIDIYHAYNRRLRDVPGLGGRIDVQFAIDESGKVIYVQMVESTVGDTKLEEIVTDKVKSWHFGRIDKPGDVTEVIYPFVFEY